MTIYVGIDGGGSNTEACLMDLQEGCVFTVVGPATNPNGVGWEAATSRIVALIREGVGQLGARLEDIGHICAAIAGVGNPEYRSKLAHHLAQREPQWHLTVISDAQAALTAGTLGQPGIVLIGGTGSIALAENAHGEEFRAGGHGYLIGDEGSGFEIGRKGLIAAIAFAEGRGAHTALWECVQQRFLVQSPGALVPIIYGSENAVTTVASFAESVIRLSEDDEMASRIMDEAALSHVRLIDAVAHPLQRSHSDFNGDGLAAVKVGLAGGLYTATDALLRRLQPLLTTYDVSRSTVSAAAGAALRAARADESDPTAAAAVTQRWKYLVSSVNGTHPPKA